MTFEQVEKLKMKFPIDSTVYLNEGIDRELSFKQKGSVVLHDTEGLYVYFDSGSVRYFNWKEVAEGAILSQYEVDKLEASKHYNDQYTSVVVRMMDTESGMHSISYLYGFHNMKHINHFVNIMNRPHWKVIWGQGNSSVLEILVALKENSRAEVRVPKRLSYRQLVEELRKNINHVASLQREGFRPDVDPSYPKLCLRDLDEMLKLYPVKN